MWLTALKLSFRTNYYRYYYLLTYSVFWSFVGVGDVSGVVLLWLFTLALCNYLEILGWFNASSNSAQLGWFNTSDNTMLENTKLVHVWHTNYCSCYLVGVTGSRLKANYHSQLLVLIFLWLIACHTLK